MLNRIEEYELLVDEYDTLIWEQPQSLEREEERQEVVKRMEYLWVRMNNRERSDAIRYATKIYEERIGYDR